MIDRRSLLVTGSLGLGALGLPGFTGAQTLMGARGFTHSVASGEPAHDSVLFWTRYVPSYDGETEVRVEVAETPDFARTVGAGAQITGPWRDYTIKITVDGLRPARNYFYRFIASDGSFSDTGRTRTLPEEGPASWRAAIFSCSNMGFGYFNAYAHAAARDDLDCSIHLGDYFYEYGPGVYPTRAQAVPGREPQPPTEVVHLTDYRLRYASYRADPDLQALHRRLPMIAQWDDHESADNSWEWGAENHNSATQGPWGPRRQAAMQVYREWMPVSDEPWKVYDIGNLASLYRTETRLLARTEQPDIAPLLKELDPQIALARFRDGAWQDPAATMMGSQQEAWLTAAIRASVRSGRRWQVVGFGTVMGKTVMPVEAAAWVGGANAETRSFITDGIAAARVGLPFNYDNWGGYPAARARFLSMVQQAGADTIVITGDSHNAWAYNLAHDGHPAAVEFAGHSVTSPGYESGLSIDPRTVARALIAANPELGWCDTSRRGYMTMTLAPDRVSNDWIAMDTILARNSRSSVMHRATVLPGRHILT